MKTLITEIAENVHLSDHELNIIIANHINDMALGVTVDSWRLTNYELLRKWSYPPYADYLDAIVKIELGDPLGATQLSDYVSACEAVKQRFPKV